MVGVGYVNADFYEDEDFGVAMHGRGGRGMGLGMIIRRNTRTRTTVGAKVRPGRPALKWWRRDNQHDDDADRDLGDDDDDDDEAKR